MKETAFLAVIFLSVLIMLTACGGGNIEGSWQSDNPSDVLKTSYAKDYSKTSVEIVFVNNGTYSIFTYEDGVLDVNTSSSGNYKYENNKLIIDGASFDCKINGNKMTWSIEGSSITWTRK